jgi:hypothetical protein
MEFATPGPQHQWLQQLVGEWTFEHVWPKKSDPPPPHATGTETVRAIGGLWVVGEMTSALMDGRPWWSQVTLGYDPARERFVGTWIGSVMTHLWIYEGQLDTAGEVLTLEAEGPSMTGPGMTRYRDVVELRGGARALSSYQQHADGTWKQFMRMEFRRA